jgi:hypothetical protein
MPARHVPDGPTDDMNHHPKPADVIPVWDRHVEFIAVALTPIKDRVTRSTT